jgi:predicted Rossmann fold nucleotide-binding protein DprA/Smf involved in DNA uptake
MLEPGQPEEVASAETSMLLRNPATLQWRGQRLWLHGNADLLEQPLDALLCSKACPGSKIMEAMDLAQRWRGENRAVVSGFHTPVEKECLRIFLRGPQPVVICPARGLDPFRLPADWQTKFQRNELLIVSTFVSGVRRPTRETAEERTCLVFALATRHTIIHATPGGVLDRIRRGQDLPCADENSRSVRRSTI